MKKFLGIILCSVGGYLSLTGLYTFVRTVSYLSAHPFRNVITPGSFRLFAILGSIAALSWFYGLRLMRTLGK